MNAGDPFGKLELFSPAELILFTSGCIRSCCGCSFTPSRIHPAVLLWHCGYRGANHSCCLLRQTHSLKFLEELTHIVCKTARQRGMGWKNRTKEKMKHSRWTKCFCFNYRFVHIYFFNCRQVFFYHLQQQPAPIFCFFILTLLITYFIVHEWSSSTLKCKKTPGC